MCTHGEDHSVVSPRPRPRPTCHDHPAPAAPPTMHQRITPHPRHTAHATRHTRSRISPPRPSLGPRGTRPRHAHAHAPWCRTRLNTNLSLSDDAKLQALGALAILECSRQPHIQGRGAKSTPSGSDDQDRVPSRRRSQPTQVASDKGKTPWDTGLCVARACRPSSSSHICPASAHTALVSSPSLAVLHLPTYLPTGEEPMTPKQKMRQRKRMDGSARKPPDDFRRRRADQPY